MILKESYFISSYNVYNGTSRVQRKIVMSKVLKITKILENLNIMCCVFVSVCTCMPHITMHIVHVRISLVVFYTQHAFSTIGYLFCLTYTLPRCCDNHFKLTSKCLHTLCEDNSIFHFNLFVILSRLGL